MTTIWLLFQSFSSVRVLQLEHFCEAFTKLDDVYRESENVLKATGLMALIVWLLSGVLFYLFERDNLNWKADGCTTADFKNHKDGCNLVLVTFLVLYTSQLYF